MEEKRIVKPWQAGLMLLVGTWMASGTVPVMIYYGMKVLTPGLFLPVVCILCTLMSTMAGTSWGTLATVGVACMGVAQGLGVPLPAAAARSAPARSSATRSRRCLTRPSSPPRCARCR